MTFTHFFIFDPIARVAKAFIINVQNNTIQQTTFFDLVALTMQNLKSFISALILQIFFSRYSEI